MYKILIKRLNTTKNLFEPYMVNAETDTDLSTSETIETVDTFGKKIKVKSEQVEYTTDDLLELAEKYKELLASYTT